MISLVSAVSIVFGIILYHKNKELNRRNRHLYEKSLETLRNDGMADSSAQDVKEKPEKYSGSSLSQEDKDALMERIMHTMGGDADFCSMDFSANTLAELLNTPYKYISQVINEKTGCNFNEFLNRFRIKEACRRINFDEGFSRLTVEAMVHEIGFRSRTTFTSAFKKEIGLTPSEYIRQYRKS